VIRWDGPSGYVVAFSTRRGGVSTGPYSSLNLGLLTDDDVANHKRGGRVSNLNRIRGRCVNLPARDHVRI